MKTYTFTFKSKIWKITARNYEVACMMLKVLTHAKDGQFISQYVKKVA